MTMQPGTPDAENVPLANTIADHFDSFFRTVVASRDSLVTTRCFRYITGEPHPFGNLAVFSRSATPADVTRDASPLCEGAFPGAIAFLDLGTPAQISAAASLGFSPAESMPLMSVSPDTLSPTFLPDGYTFREVTSLDSSAWARAVAEGYGIPVRVASRMSPERAEASCPGKARHFTIEHGGRMVATSLVYLHDGLAGIYGVSTLPGHRGRGLGAHLTAEPLRIAWGLGYSTGLLQASEMGAPVYERIGFRTHGHMTLLVRMPG